MNTLDNLKKKIGNKERNLELDDIDFIHHKLMVYYGWINIEEFRRIPLPTLWNLIDKIRKQEEEEKRQADKLKRK